MRIEELIGQRIRERRKALGLTGEQVGERLEPLIGKWARQAVSAAEHGKRAFNAAELYALAQVLDMTVTELIVTPVGSTVLEMPTGTEIKVVNAATLDTSADQLRDALRQVARSVGQAHRTAEEAHRKAVALIDAV